MERLWEVILHCMVCKVRHIWERVWKIVWKKQITLTCRHVCCISSQRGSRTCHRSLCCSWGSSPYHRSASISHLLSPRRSPQWQGFSSWRRTESAWCVHPPPGSSNAEKRNIQYVLLKLYHCSNRHPLLATSALNTLFGRLIHQWRHFPFWFYSRMSVLCITSRKLLLLPVYCMIHLATGSSSSPPHLRQRQQCEPLSRLHFIAMLMRNVSR